MLNLILSMLMMIIFILMMISFILKTKHHNKWQEKLSSFECGFDSNHSSRTAFSLRFFIITIVFLIFDIEIAIMLPLPLMEENFSTSNKILLNLFFFMLLWGGLIFEWMQGALEWS